MSIITSRESVTLTSAGQKMFGIIHRPAAPGTYPAVVLLHGFLGSKDQPHRMLVETAEALAKSSIIAFRVDLRGRAIYSTRRRR
jgi:dienelactone hydrolase